MGANLPWKGRIESLTHEGLGVGVMKIEKDDQVLKRPIFVPHTVPGDEVEAEVAKSKGKYNFGTLLKIIEPSPDRVEPRCPHFGVCGGCNLQHVKYERQLEEKAKMVSFLLKRKNIDIPKDIKVLPARKLHKYRWRSKIAIAFKDGKCTVGFRKYRSKDIVTITTCFIVAPEIREFITLLNNTTHNYADQEFEVIAIVGENKKTGVLVSLDRIEEEKQKDVRSFFEDLYATNRKYIGNLFLEIDGKIKTVGQVQEHIMYTLNDFKFMFLPQTFIQANIPTNELLVNQGLKLFPLEEEDVVLDLYAGIGNFSLPIAQKVKEVIAVEGYESAVISGETNALQNAIKNVKFIHKSAEEYIVAPHDVTKVVLDPPRTGCTPEVLEGVLKLGVKNILYVSCNPLTLARDLVTLTKQYKVEDIIGIDMFPDISHVETIVLLTKS